MARKHTKQTTGQKKSRASTRQGLEWIGARFAAPVYVTEGGPHRPEMILWFELPTELIVGMDIVDPKNPISFGDALGRTLARPMAGPARAPDRVRVATVDLAEQVRAVVGDSIPIEVAPTPEVDNVVDHMRREIPGGRELSYLDDGRLPEEGVGRLFEAARELYLCAPWTRVQDDNLLRVDVPALGLEGACISIIGALGQSFGFVAFPSQVAFEAFLQATARGMPEEGPVDLGTPHLALNFEAHRDMPKTMLREAAAHGWPLASSKAYPLPMRIDRDAVPHPLEPHDLDVLAGAALALARLFAAHGEAIGRGQPAEATSVHRDGIEARACCPYDWAPAGSPAAAQQKTSIDVNALEGRLAEAMWRFAYEKFGKAWDRVRRSVKDFDDLLPFSIAWSLYRYRVKGRTLADWFFDEYKDRLSEPERTWLEVQRHSWLGVWEIEAFEPGATLDLKDLLTGERRRVQEKMGSRGVNKRNALFGSVVEFRGTCFMTGTYPRLVPPMDAFKVVRDVAAALNAKPGEVPVERLREESGQRLLLDRWQRALREAERRSSIPPRLANTDGDPILFTNDRFAFDPSERTAIEACVRGLGVDVDEGERQSTSVCFAVVRQEKAKASALQSTLLGRIEVGEGTLRIETNSVRRADTLRRRVEEGCGGRLKHRSRDHADPVASLASGDHGAAGAPRPQNQAPTPEMLEVLREHKARYYGDWADQTIPALDGRTPREASREPEGRGRLDALIKEMESMESRLPVAEQYDFQVLRQLLSLDVNK
jgi:hypothetical protein